MFVVTPRIQIPLDEITFTFVRSSGPGGQNVNKVNSKAVMRWPARQNTTLPEDVRSRFFARYGNQLTGDGELVITSQRYRDQGRNVDDCHEKLRTMLASVAVAPKKRRPSKPSRASKERRLKSKAEHSRKKQQRRKGGRGDED